VKRSMYAGYVFGMIFAMENNIDSMSWLMPLMIQEKSDENSHINHPENVSSHLRLLAKNTATRKQRASYNEKSGYSYRFS
jgi:hypothetical protein